MPPWTAVLPVNPTSHPGLLQAVPSLLWWTPDPHPHTCIDAHTWAPALNLILAYSQTGWVPHLTQGLAHHMLSASGPGPSVPTRCGLALPWTEPKPWSCYRGLAPRGSTTALWNQHPGPACSEDLAQAPDAGVLGVLPAGGCCHWEGKLGGLEPAPDTLSMLLAAWGPPGLAVPRTTAGLSSQSPEDVASLTCPLSSRVAGSCTPKSRLLLKR